MRRILSILALLIAAISSLHGQRTITGSVRNIEGDPVIAANIQIEGTTIGTVTDTLSRFSLDLPAGYNVILISYTGYETHRIVLGASNIVDVVLQESSVALNEAIVVGYGTQSRRNITSSIASVDAMAFKNISVQGFEQALHGRLPGVFISGNSGSLGAQQAIRIRGVGSINASNQPLVVMDGIILNNDVGTSNGAGGPGTNPFINLNPNDIASIDVLKDAAAAAVYGSRGSNGVILITSKTGRYNMQPQIQLGYYTGLSTPTNQFEVLNGKQYAELWNRGMAYRGEGISRFYNVDEQPNTDWYDEVTQLGLVQETNASVMGGTANTRYYMGGTFRDENGWLKTTNLKRYSLRLHFEQKLNSKWTAGMMLNPSRTLNQRQFEDYLLSSQQTYAALYFPNIAARDENGNVRGGLLQTSIGSTMSSGTPLANLSAQNFKTITNQVLANFYAHFQPWKHIKFRSEFGAQVMIVDDFWKGASYGTGGFDKGRGRVGNQQVTNWTWNNVVTYQKDINENSFDVTLGYFMNREDISFITTAGLVFANDRLQTLNSAAEIIDGDVTLNESTFNGYMGRLNYAYAHKYLFTASMYIDGSSRFGINNRYGYFPAFSAGWIVSDEAFWRNKDAISFLKLRASWGLTGNAGIDNFASLGLIAFNHDYNSVPGFVFDRLENPDLQWEKNRTLDVGLEFGLLKNRLHGFLLYYNRNTFDLLLNVPVPQTTGIYNSFITKNAGAVVNRGIEFAIDADILTKALKWNVSLHAATVHNEVLYLIDNNNDGKEEDIVNGRFIIRKGEAIGSFYLVEYAGVDHTNGDALFYDNEGNASKKYTLDSRAVFGSAIPKFSGGISNQLTWSSFDLSFLFQYALGFNLYREEGTFIQTQMASVYNQTVDQLQAWTPDNPNSDIPQARGASNGNQHSTRYLSRGDFVRLKNVQLGYTINPTSVNKTQVRLFLSAQNLITLTDFEGLDPEASSLKVSGALSGNIFFSRPQSKTWTLGVNVTL